MGYIQGFIFAQRKEIFFICVVGFGIQFWLHHGFCEWPKEINLSSIGYINGYLFISMCILTDLPKRKTLGHYAKGRSSFSICSCIPIHLWRFPYSWVLPRFRNTFKLMPKRTHSKGNFPYNFIVKLIFHQNCLTMLHGSMITNDSV